MWEEARSCHRLVLVHKLNAFFARGAALYPESANDPTWNTDLGETSELPPCKPFPSHLRCRLVNKKTPPPYEVLRGQCAGEAVCPLSHVRIGARVCVRHINSQPEVCDRLRELGLVEDQEVRLVSRHHNVICQICNARVALSEALADAILVQPLAPTTPVQ
jgi:Fe2+ transport system protein FeoA